MHKLFKNISLFILSLQEKILSRKLKGAMGTTFVNSTSKTVLSKDYTVNFNTETEKNKEKLKKEVTHILKEFENDVDKILGYIELEGTKVYNLKFADKILIDLYNGYFREWDLAEKALNANHANRRLMLRYKHQLK